MTGPDLVAIRELAVALTTYNIDNDPVPAGIDVPDDYERGINDAGWRLHALVNPDQTRVTPPACPSCGEPISARYLPHGVCQNCYGTDDDTRHTTPGDRSEP